MKISTKNLLQQIQFPSDLRTLEISSLNQVCNELRQETIEIVSNTGGHLGAGLGVVELTVALHYVFDTPRDKLIWDIGHQAYPHKILTGRRKEMTTLRKPGGISGFTKKSESEYDTFIGGHGGTAISSALGMAVARDLNAESHHVIAVIGDGSMSAGMAYEAMNNAGSISSNLIVILNDNKMSIAPAVGALTSYLAKLISSQQYINFRNRSKKFLEKLPRCVGNLIKKFERNTKDLINNGNFFEEMGFYYIGPVDGHNVEEIVILLKNLKQDSNINKPVLMHIVTEKGKGFVSDKNCAEKYHAIAKFDPITGKEQKIEQKTSTFTEVFANTLIKLATEDQKIVAITAAMPSGTGLKTFAEVFKDRMFDVGMAEQHAVTFAAGLACEGIKPYVVIYSTFLQRAYDQVINDVALQNLPVRFIIDRAGYVGADGPTHAGSFDLPYLCALPNFIVMCPADEIELALMLKTSVTINDAPCAIRFPRGNVYGLTIPDILENIIIGKARIIREGKDIVILSLGTRLQQVIRAADKYEHENGRKVTIIDARFAKPLDENLICAMAVKHKYMITIEEGAIGGFASHVSNLLNKNSLLTQIKLKTLFYPDIFVEQNTQEAMHSSAQMEAEEILNLFNSLHHN